MQIEIWRTAIRMALVLRIKLEPVLSQLNRRLRHVAPRFCSKLIQQHTQSGDHGRYGNRACAVVVRLALPGDITFTEIQRSSGIKIDCDRASRRRMEYNGTSAIATDADGARHDYTHCQHRRNGRVGRIPAASHKLETSRSAKWMTRGDRGFIGSKLHGGDDANA